MKLAKHILITSSLCILFFCMGAYFGIKEGGKISTFFSAPGKAYVASNNLEAMDKGNYSKVRTHQELLLVGSIIDYSMYLDYPYPLLPRAAGLSDDAIGFNTTFMENAIEYLEQNPEILSRINKESLYIPENNYDDRLNKVLSSFNSTLTSGSSAAHAATGQPQAAAP